MNNLWWMLAYKFPDTQGIHRDVFAAPTGPDAWRLFESDYEGSEYFPVRVNASIVVPFGLTNEELSLDFGPVAGTCGVVQEWWNGDYQYIEIYRKDFNKLYRRLSVLWRTNFGWEEE